MKSAEKIARGAAANAGTDVSALGTGLLQNGSKGPEVEALQQMLNERTGGNLEVDGVFGDKTLAAVREFQQSQGIDVDGIVGNDTRNSFAGGAGTNANAAEELKQQAQQAAGTQGASGIPGLDDTSWTDKLPSALKPHAQAFLDAGEKYGIDPRFLAAVTMHESGNGTSSAFRNKNNAMGSMGSNGLKSFDSIAASINFQSNSLTRDGGYYSGKDTIATISNTYAPIGAANDPTGLNANWRSGVGGFYESLGGDPSAQVKAFD